MTMNMSHPKSIRRTILFSTLLFLGILTTVSVSSAVDLGDPSPSQVFLFEHTNYKGASMSHEFDADVPDLTKWRLPNSKKSWNDVISSMKVGKNAKITFYEHKNYRGASVTMQGDGRSIKKYSSLHSIGWGDKVSSFKVRMSDYAQ